MPFDLNDTDIILLIFVSPASIIDVIALYSEHVDLSFPSTIVAEFIPVKGLPDSDKTTDTDMLSYVA